MDIPKSKPQRSLISLTPLVDVVFILLVFFMLTSRFVQWQFVALSVDDAASLPIDTRKQSMIKVRADQRYSLNGQAMTLDAIVDHIRRQLRRQDDHPVFIQPADDLPLHALMVVFDRLGELGSPTLSLVREATLEKEK
ncbi:MAG: biopolymer transporter ExbD [Cellvibrionaceae bacterium]|nr:biopolymer transporter ExbD [Cellvibrionaceae bacterium]